MSKTIKLNLTLKNFGKLDVMNIMQIDGIKEGIDYQVIDYDTNLLIVKNFIEEELKIGNKYVNRQTLSELSFELREIEEYIEQFDSSVNVLNYLFNKNIIKELNRSEVYYELCELKDYFKSIK